jgi:NADPH:quinone reductase-like Zn-dependent oxidoreductase
MKAVLLDKPGPPSSLRIGDISTPRPRVDEALVRVCATSLNPVDYKVAAQAAAGGVGGFAVQMAKAEKAFVIGTCSASNAKYVRELGPTR